MKEKIQQNSTDSTLPPKQLEVIEALASGASVTEAAKRAGADRTTIYVWRKDYRDFDAQLTLARREYADTMRARLRDLADDAVKTVREIMQGTDTPPAVRLKAALSVLQCVGSSDKSTPDADVVEKWRSNCVAKGPIQFRVVYDRENGKKSQVNGNAESNARPGPGTAL